MAVAISRLVLLLLESPTNTNMPKEYTMADKIAGRDLHGLSCRIPEPTPEQAKCSHTELVERDRGYKDWDTGQWVKNMQWEEEDVMDDIPGTNNIRCPLCGYTRRY